MSFFESPRFPEGISNGAKGGPGYSTDVVVVNSGFEQRNGIWTMARCSYDVGHGVKSQTDMATLIAFFRVCKGRLHGFRFKDWADYAAAGSEGVVALISGSTYQMYKRYTNAAGTEDRVITKPVSGTVSVAGGGTYSINYATGVITVTAGAVPTGWTGEFDVPCRFDTDQMDVTIDQYGRYSWGSIPIVEIRV